MPLFLAMASVLTLMTAVPPEAPPTARTGLRQAMAESLAAHHEAAMRRVAATPGLAGTVSATPYGRNVWRVVSCTDDGVVATYWRADAGKGAALLPGLRRMLGDPPGLGIADGSDTLPGVDGNRHALPCAVRAGAVVLVGRL